MGLTRCPFCKQEVDSEAVKCFFCGAAIYHHSDIPEPIMSQEQQNAQKVLKAESIGNLKIIILMIAAIIIFLLLAFFLVRRFD